MEIEQPLQSSPEEPSSPLLPAELSTADNAPEASSSAAQAVGGLDVAHVADQILNFLSTAGPEVLAAVVAGAAMVLYMLFGSLGLLLVGVVMGVVLHASLENLRSSKGVTKGAGVVGLPEWLERRMEAESSGDDKGIAKGNKTCKLSQKAVDFSSLPPETAAAMSELTDAVIRDYVRWWYTPMVPTFTSFPGSCHQLLTRTLLNVHSHISSKRPTDTFLLFLVSTSNTFIVFFRELAQAAQSSIGTYIEEYPSSALAQLVDREVQKRKLKMAADDVVDRFLPEEARECEPVRAFLTEILAGVVLEKTVEKCSSAEWINTWICYLLEPETQPEVLKKIDIGEAAGAVTGGNGGGKGNKEAEVNDKKRLSRAEEEMEKAMREAQELSKMIAEEEEKAKRASMISTTSSTTNGAHQNELTASPTRASFDKAEILPSIPTPIPEENVPEFREPTPPPQPPRPASNTAFTSFDQLVPPTEPLDLLHRAHVTLSDLSPSPPSAAPEKPLRSKPSSAVYLLQIEPFSTAIPGWILTRKYTDFESLHEVLRRISRVSGVTEYYDLPSWRGETKETLRGALEKYLNDTLKVHMLAESEGMKRFLEKDTEMQDTKTGGGFVGLGKGWPNPQALAKVGGGVLDVLTKAPQGAAEGGKAFFGGVFGGGGGMRRLSKGLAENTNYNGTATNNTAVAARVSADSARKLQQLEGREGAGSSATFNEESGSGGEEIKPALPPRSLTGQSIQLEIPSDDAGVEVLHLPPPPSDIPDDYDDSDSQVAESALTRRRAGSNASSLLAPNTSANLSTNSSTSNLANSTITESTTNNTPPLSPRKKLSEPLTAQETAFAVEIIFALISELYTLSSAWIFRRSLLNVAKSILLRPGNSSLESIRLLVQESVIEKNTKDEAVAGYLRKLRASAFPTKEELKQWEEKNGRKKKDGMGVKDGGEEERRERARRLVREKGMPEALRGVMGAGASAECCSVMFDALQEKAVARGVVVGLICEAVRGVCQ